jgi:RNA polymerase sigma-70 factor (ECF subfamily)
MPLEWAVSWPAYAEHELVERLRSHDEAALFELYVGYGRRLFAHAVRLTGSPDRAEEVVQDSLLAAWRTTGSYRGEGSVLAWLLGIVRNKSLNAIRRRAPVTTTLDEVAEIPAAAPRPDVQAEARERDGRVRAAMARLSLEHREVLDLVFFQGLSLAETASVCGCPVGTVKSRLFAAKSRLREALGQEGRQEGGGRP